MNTLEVAGSDEQQSEHPIEQWLFIFVMLLVNCFLHFTATPVDADPSTSVDPNSGSALAQAVWSIVYAGAFAGLWVERRRAWSLLRGSWPIVLLVALICFSSLWSSDPGLTAKRAFGVLGTTAIAYYVACRFSLWTFVKLFGISTVIGAVLSAIFIVAVPSLGIVHGDQYEGSWQGIYIFKNEFGEAMSLGIVTLLVIALRTTGSLRLYAFGAIALCSVLLLGSRSATAVVLVLLISGVLGLALLWRSKRHRGIAWATTLIAVFALAACVIDSDPLMALLGRDASFTGRGTIWTVAMSGIVDHPLLGYGYGVFWLDNGAYVDYVARTTTDFWLPPDAHNGFLQISLDVGLVGAALAVLALLYGSWRAARYVATGPDVSSVWPLVVIASFIFRNLTESCIASYNNLYWIVFVAAFLYAIKPERQLDDPYLRERNVVLIPGGLQGPQRSS